MTKARELSDYTGLQADITAGDTAARAGRKNLLLNGSMQVAQRGTSVTSITGNGFHTCDRWYLQVGNLGTHTVTQETLTSGNAYNDGFTKAFRVDCTTADASPAASDHIFFQQKIEAQNLQHLAYGTSGAKALTLSFWVKSNKTGTYEIMHYVADSSRQVNSTYTINSANTWEKKVLSIPADTGGSGINNDNEEGFRSLFYLAVGSQRQSGSTPTSWQAYGVGNEASSQTVNIGDNTANDWAITGYQLEVGSVATDFEHRTYAESLLACQRYYEIIAKPTAADDSPYFGIGHGYKSDQINWFYDFKAEKRAPITLIVNTVTNGYYGKNHSTEKNYNTLGITMGHQSLHSIQGYMTNISGVTEQSAYTMQCNGAGCLIAASAEL